MFSNVDSVLDKDNGQLIRLVEDFTHDIEQNDLALLYFSGHGRADALGNLYLVCRNSIGNRLNSTTFPILLLRNILQDCLSEKIVIVLDCCHSGLAGSALLKGDQSALVADELSAGLGHFVISSSGAERSWIAPQSSEPDSKQMSLFTKHLVSGIETELADMNGDGFVDVEEWFEYARRQTEKERPEQQPSLAKRGARGGNLYIAKTQRRRAGRSSKSVNLFGMIDADMGFKREFSSTMGVENAYSFEDVHAISGFSLLHSSQIAPIGLISTNIYERHPIFEGVKVDTRTFVDGRIVDAPGPADDYTTGLAGILVGPRTFDGFLGIAPGAALSICDVFAGRPSANQADIASAIDYLSHERMVRVICLPLSSGEPSAILDDTLQDAIERGCVVICGVGNLGEERKTWPAAFPGVVSVAALDRRSQKLAGSDFGDWVDVAAPGEGIWTAGGDRSFRQASGAAFSCAIVAGATALMMAVNPKLTSAETKGILRATAEAVFSDGEYLVGKLGAGKLNIFRAIEAAKLRV
jgi:hypothetical protein